MLVSAKQTQMIPLPKRPGEDPSAEAAAGLQSGMQGAMLQALQTNVQAQAQASATQQTTQQVNEASKISDNIDEAFAKTRVALQAADPSKVPADIQGNATDSSAMTDFKDYMSKTPEQRLRDSILKDMGITEEDLKAMPPEKQQAVAQEIANRMQDKMKLAQAEKETSSSEKSGTQVVDKFLASL
ncbi:hypothetical protein J2X66_002905 [Pseudomonas sp. 3296]|uniref:hypothetical protein n=1 Tax=Pseudomonas sp. 3296 TaxID=2817753 RepID=UPI00285A95E9|nr:hypothetical protein [Pseudomonas sp. 3296]MDR6916036.1 hypothetical protein [Pseudomonas sp. 3296]